MSTNSPPPGNQQQLQYCRFAIDETPVCVWSFDLDGANRSYLSSLDPSYFMTIAGHLATESFDVPDGQARALAIRSLYGHASETLLALLGAAVQAPDCVPGWMGRYRNDDLREVLTKISHGASLRNRLGRESITWEALSEFIHAPVTFGGTHKKHEYTKAIGIFWRRLANEQLEPHIGDEYNAIKHGLRTGAGGFSIAIGLEETPGVRCPPEKMGPHRGSKFGSSTHAPVKIEGTKRHFRISHVANNWDPAVLVLRLGLISMSMGNVVSRLRHLAGEPAESIKFEWPVDPEDFERAWPGRPWPFTSSFGDNLSLPDIENLSDQEILAVYADTSREPNESTPAPDAARSSKGGGS